MYKETSFGPILTALEKQKYFVGRAFIDESLCQKLQELARTEWELDHFRRAQTGRAENQKIRTSIRTDEIHWIENWSKSSELNVINEFLTQLRESINLHFFQSLKRHESHFSIYQNGSFYKKHIDYHQETKNRKISCVLYLNTAPPKEGELILYSPDDKMQIEKIISPEIGTFVCFLSEFIYHEVTPSISERWALTSWIRDDEIIF